LIPIVGDYFKILDDHHYVYVYVYVLDEFDSLNFVKYHRQYKEYHLKSHFKSYMRIKVKSNTITMFNDEEGK